jgi:subtilisin family serine protease
MKKISLIIALLVLSNLALCQQLFYYSNNSKVYLTEDKSYLLVLVNSNKTQFAENIIQPMVAKYFDSYEISPTYNLIKIKPKNSDKATNAIALLKNNPDVKAVWYSIYTQDNIPIIPTGEILYSSKSNLKAPFDNSLNTNADGSNSNMFNIATNIDNSEIFAIANSYYENGDAKWCHPNFWSPISLFTNDPLWNQQYYLRNTGQLGGIAGIDINLVGAWNITRGNPNLRVAVIDQGVENHPDLGNRVLNGFTPINATGNGRPIGTGNGHGVACAGIIAATQDNNIGITGVAPQVQIVPVNIFAGNETAADLGRAIDWAWNQGQAAVLSNSWGYGSSSISFDAINNAINNARTLGRNGLGSVVVFAAGNGGGDVTYPANVNGVIAVGAINNIAPAGSLWYYSSHGASMDIVAPSGDVNLQGDVVTTDRQGGNGYETGDFTNRFGGTSAACPQVAGVAALMLSANNTLTEAQVTQIIQNTATDMGAAGFDNNFGFGRINACRAVSTSLTNSITSSSNTICNTPVTFSVQNLPIGASLVWNHSPSGIVSQSINANSITLSKIKSGLINLTASVTTNFCGMPLINQLPLVPITVGTPTPTLSVYAPNGIYAPSTFQITAQPTNSTYNYTWYVNNVQAGAIFNSNIYDLYLMCRKSKTISCRISNACGSALGAGVLCVGGCTKISPYFRYAIAPHPTITKNITIGIDQTTTDEQAKLFFDATALAAEQVQQVKVIDKEGNVVIDIGDIGTQVTTLDLTALIEGVYNIEIYGNNDYREQQTIQIAGVKSDKQIAEDLATSNIIISSQDATKLNEVLQQELYQKLKADATLADNSTVLQNFMLTKEQGSFGTIDKINEALYNYDITAAQTLINAWLPTTNLELNSLQYYNYFIKYLNGGTFTNNEMSDMFSFANLCPQKNGEIIFAARSLYNYISQLDETFPTACGNNLARGYVKVDAKAKVGVNNISIYPNPSKGNFSIKFPSASRGVNTVKVLDTYGKTILQQSVISGIQNININKTLASGIYTVQITNNITGKTETQKLIIQ